MEGSCPRRDRVARGIGVGWRDEVVVRGGARLKRLCTRAEVWSRSAEARFRCGCDGVTCGWAGQQNSGEATESRLEAAVVEARRAKARRLQSRSRAGRVRPSVGLGRVSGIALNCAAGYVRWANHAVELT